ncbi:hypothetical protein F1721_21345 [Saccharopolyspora hirsuta]|uniref:Uncharacterized protein n=1 Tax=Saccharopolyspora hirsuta TaxID=1837 RepID=A0A5M7BM97_SACHI|nr:hypothetical protein [Saccharopolyspora hirsuta]KAA5831286.1 hypothetical protein F1721_21345 [Saccharopolyspora hirsuta]
MPSRNVRFVGGPLDGRMQDLRDSEAVAGRLLRHIHLHDGPKIETHYELHYSPEAGWVYRLCGQGHSGS